MNSNSFRSRKNPESIVALIGEERVGKKAVLSRLREHCGGSVVEWRGYTDLPDWFQQTSYPLEMYIGSTTIRLGERYSVAAIVSYFSPLEGQVFIASDVEFVVLITAWPLRSSLDWKPRSPGAIESWSHVISAARSRNPNAKWLHVLNKVDLLTPEQIAEAEATLKAHLDAPIVRTIATSNDPKVNGIPQLIDAIAALME